MVKVTAQIRWTGVPARTSATMRSTRLVVLPVPAAASTSRLRSIASRIRARAVASGRPGVFSATEIPPGGERAGRCFFELPFAAAPRLFAVRTEAREVFADEAVGVLVGRVRKRSRGEQVEEGIERPPGLLLRVRDREALTEAAAPREKVAGARDGRSGGGGRSAPPGLERLPRQ